MNETEGTVVGIFPNPTNGILSIVFPKSSEGTRISLYSTEGKLIRVLNESAKAGTFVIDLRDVAAALYYLKFENQQAVFFRKVVRN